MRIWVTRTEPQAHETAERLRAMGHEPVVAPVLAVLPMAADLALTDVAGLVFTSRNGVSAFTALSARRDLPVYAVGGATALDARAAGFEEVHSAEGDVEALAYLIASRPPGGILLHAGAREPAGDLAGALASAGVSLRTVPIYETVETNVAPPEGVEAVLIHSPRAARAVAAALAGRSATGLSAFAISEAAAAPISHAIFGRVAVAPYPNEQALLNLLL